MIVLSTFTLCSQTSSTREANVFSIVDDFGSTEYMILGLLGDSATATEFLIPNAWQMLFRVVFMAVAVSAIMFTLKSNVVMQLGPHSASRIYLCSPHTNWCRVFRGYSFPFFRRASRATLLIQCSQLNGTADQEECREIERRLERLSHQSFHTITAQLVDFVLVGTAAACAAFNLCIRYWWGISPGPLCTCQSVRNLTLPRDTGCSQSYTEPMTGLIFQSNRLEDQPFSQHFTTNTHNFTVAATY